MKKCYLDNKISCNFVDVCKSEHNQILSYEKFIYYSHFFSELNYTNITLMKHLITKGYRNGIYDHFYEKMSDILLYKKEVKEVLGNDFTYIIEYDTYNKFQLYSFIKTKEKINKNKLYPNCCTDSYIKRNGIEGDKELGYHKIFKMNFNTSNFFCPLIKYNFSLKDNGAINFPFLPYYEPCSFDCEQTIKYIDNIYNYMDRSINIDEIFTYNKTPVILHNNHLLTFNGYFNKGVIYYSGVVISSFDNIGKFKYIDNINIPEIRSEFIILHGLLQKDIPNIVKLKHIK